MTATAAEIGRLWLLIALIVAAGGKSFAFTRFQGDLRASFPELGHATLPIAFVIVAAEWMLAVLVLTGGVTGQRGLLGAALLFAVLTAVIAVALAQDRTVVCRCFGAESHRLSAYDLIRNLLLIAVALFAAATPSLMPIDVFSHLALAAIALTLFQLSIHLQDIAAVLRIRT